MTAPSASRADRAAAWIYRGLWGVIVSWLRVPALPDDLPSAAGEAPTRFHPAPGFLRYLKFFFWFALIAIDLAIMLAWALLFANQRMAGWILLGPALVLAIVPDVLAYIAIHLRYDTTWYVMTDRALRIRRGVWSINEITITFENVQNVKITQGPVQRIFSISNLAIETAGSGGGEQGGAVSNQALIEGVSEAEALRDRIMARVRRSRSAGLGDEDDGRPARHGGAWTPERLDALRAVREEARALIDLASG
ncbi:MAG: PH domain-containing protein [Phycisphaerales bacterium]